MANTTPQSLGNIHIQSPGLSSAASTAASELAAVANNTVYYKDNSGVVRGVALGASGTVLTSAGTTSTPTFSANGTGDVSKVGTPVNNQVGVWTGDGTLEGDVALTFDTTTDTLTTVNINGINTIAFDITPVVPSYAEGNVYWDETDKTLVIEQGVDDVKLQVGQEMYVRARNATGSTIVNGSVVYISGQTGNRPNITLAQADAAATSENIGVATHDIENNSDGLVTVTGLVRGIDTSSFLVGDVVYLSASVAGGITTTAPASPNFVIKVGRVITSNVSTGIILVFNQDFHEGFVSFDDIRIHGTTEMMGPLELGHASDTTLARVSAGVVSVEGVRVITSAGTTSGTILKNNGTTFVASTETYAAPGTSGNVLTSDGTNWTSAAPAAGGGGFWTLVPGSPTRTGNTTFTLTDTSNANAYDSLLSRGTVVKWLESTVLKQAMIVSATYATNTVTVTIFGDTMASIDASSLKYALTKATIVTFQYPLTTAVGTDVAARFYADKAYRVFGAKAYLVTAGTTNSMTVDINKNGTTMFATKPPIASTATVGTDTSADNGSALALSDYVSLDIDSISTTAGVGLTVQLFVAPSQNSYLA